MTIWLTPGDLLTYTWREVLIRMKLGIRAQVIKIKIRLRRNVTWCTEMKPCEVVGGMTAHSDHWSDRVSTCCGVLVKLGWHALMTLLFSICKTSLQMSISGSPMWNNTGNPVHGFDTCCSSVQKLTQVPDISGYGGAGITSVVIAKDHSQFEFTIYKASTTKWHGSVFHIPWHHSCW